MLSCLPCFLPHLCKCLLTLFLSRLLPDCQLIKLFISFSDLPLGCFLLQPQLLGLLNILFQLIIIRAHQEIDTFYYFIVITVLFEINILIHIVSTVLPWSFQFVFQVLNLLGQFFIFLPQKSFVSPGVLQVLDGLILDRFYRLLRVVEFESV